MKAVKNITFGWVLAGLLVMSCTGNKPNPDAASANAGADQVALAGESVTLNGLGTTGADTVEWSFTSKPADSSASISNDNTLQAAFVPDAVGTYIAQLSINGGESTDTSTVTVNSVEANISIPSESAIRTRTRFSTDEYVMSLGETGGILSAETSRVSTSTQISSYTWEQVSGPAIVATNGTASSTLQFTAPTLIEFYNQSDHYKWGVLPIAREDYRILINLTLTDVDGNSDIETFYLYIDDDGDAFWPSSGLKNVGVGTRVYLGGPDLKANALAADTDVTDWSWTLYPPSGASSVFLDTGTTVSSLQTPSFIPDVIGAYVVAYSSNSAGTSGSFTISAGRFVGVGTIGEMTAEDPQCGACHDGSRHPDKITSWSQTRHSFHFETSMEKYTILAPVPFYWQYHTVGYNTDADNDGFDEVAATYGFEFPVAGITFDDFVDTYPLLADLSNIQCENCHGPGSEHSGNAGRISYSFSQFGVCGQCHIQETIFKQSRHNSTGVVNGNGIYQSQWLSDTKCVRCHTARGFTDYVEQGFAGLSAITEAEAFPGITCAGCHDPHSVENYKHLRQIDIVTMPVDGTSVNAGNAAICYTCHDGFADYGVESCDADGSGIDNTCLTIDQSATENYEQVHYNPQAPVLEGKGALTDLDGDGTDDVTLDENSFHTDASFTLASVTGDTTLSDENKKCITCHMSTGPWSDDPGFQLLGGHSFRLRSGETELVKACTTCHTELTTLNREAAADYDGDGTIEGIQDEVKGILYVLSEKIKSLSPTTIDGDSGTNLASDNTLEAAALSYTNDEDGFYASSDLIKRAVWNYNLIARDKSYGIHNAAFAIQVLQETYTAVGGTAFISDYPLATLR